MSIFQDHQNPKLGDDAWMQANPGRYAIYQGPLRAWHVTRDMQRIDLCNTLPEAMDAAYADAEARALAAGFTIPPENPVARAIQETQ